MDRKDHGKCTKIQWGAVLAGAAIAAGVVLFAPSLVTETIPKFFETIASTVSGWFAAAPAAAGVAAGTGAGAAAAGTGTKLAEALTSPLAQKIGGAVLIGGGISYFMSDKKQPHPAHSHASDHSFAAREDMRKMQALMAARMQATGYQPAMAMAGQGR